MDEEVELDVLAEKAYVAFYGFLDTAVDGSSYSDKEPLKKWRELSKRTRESWIAVAREIISCCPVVRD